MAFFLSSFSHLHSRPPIFTSLHCVTLSEANPNIWALGSRPYPSWRTSHKIPLLSSNSALFDFSFLVSSPSFKYHIQSVLGLYLFPLHGSSLLVTPSILRVLVAQTFSSVWYQLSLIATWNIWSFLLNWLQNLIFPGFSLPFWLQFHSLVFQSSLKY